MVRNANEFLCWFQFFQVLWCRLAAHALNALELEEESAIAVDMPMNVESVVIYLAIVLAGHVVVSIADSFSPQEISTRLKISKAKAIFTQVKSISRYRLLYKNQQILTSSFRFVLLVFRM